MSETLHLLMTCDAVGGVWQYATDLAHALRPLGVETTLAVLGPAPSAMQRETAPGLRVIETGLPLDWLAPDAAAVRATARAIGDLAHRENADLIQLNQPALAAEAMPAPVIAAIHSCVATWWAAVESGPLPADFAWQTALVRQGLASADAAICPSAAFAAAVRSAYALPLAPRVIHNGRRAPTLAAQPTGDFAFTAGRLWDRGKNVATLDRAAALLEVPVLAAGALTGPNGEGVALDHARSLGTLGSDGVRDILAQAPIFASAALYEPFGLAVLEAAQAGCALVLADIPTFRELWEGAATFVAPCDADGFATAIDSLIADPLRRAADGAAARKHAARYSDTAMATATAALYRATLERRAAA